MKAVFHNGRMVDFYEEPLIGDLQAWEWSKGGEPQSARMLGCIPALAIGDIVKHFQPQLVVLDAIDQALLSTEACLRGRTCLYNSTSSRGELCKAIEEKREAHGPSFIPVILCIETNGGYCQSLHEVLVQRALSRGGGHGDGEGGGTRCKLPCRSGSLNAGGPRHS